jgi:AcrR family transcriptional regulator
MAGRRAGRTDKYDEVRESIIDRSAALFARNGYASTGVAELGDEVGLARGALYYYIGSKNELLSAIHDRVLDPLLTGAERIRALDLSAPARLVLMSELLVEQIVDRRDHVWVFLHEHRQLVGRELRTFRLKRTQFENLVNDLLDDSVEAGLLTAADSRLTTLAWLNLHNYTYHWVGTEPNMTVRKLTDEFSRIFIRGTCTERLDLDQLEAEAARGRALLATTPPPDVADAPAEAGVAG